MTTSLVPFGTRFPHVFGDFRREMDTLMDRFLRGEDGWDVPSWYNPLANVAETEKHYEITLDLPGLKPEDVHVEFKHGDLWISGERKEETEEKGKTYHRIERQYGEFRRVIRLGDDVNPDKVEAQYQDGVLRVTVPKSESSLTKRITVKG